MRRSRQALFCVGTIMVAASWACSGAEKTAPPSPAAAASPPAKTYYSCSTGDKERFDKDPQKYVKP